ncbi:MAG: hypothetical protein Q7V14_04230 [Coriobacteriia bacterium]|nr:hypothetical protein [Coriobacteriia bacterium]MDO9108171.1 hypothetical protein [Coriobacteriia bacterium]
MGDLSALVAEFEAPGAVLMFLCTVLGALTGAIQPGAGFVMLATLAAGIFNGDSSLLPQRYSHLIESRRRNPRA